MVDAKTQHYKNLRSLIFRGRNINFKRRVNKLTLTFDDNKSYLNQVMIYQ